jgi:hypothetical protein
MSDTVPLIVVAALLLLVVGIFLRISWRLRRGGGSLTTVVLGTTDAFLTQERSKAAETIVNENAGKKFVRQSSEEPKGPIAPDSR